MLLMTFVCFLFVQQCCEKICVCVRACERARVITELLYDGRRVN